MIVKARPTHRLGGVGVDVGGGEEDGVCGADWVVMMSAVGVFAIEAGQKSSQVPDISGRQVIEPFATFTGVQFQFALDYAGRFQPVAVVQIPLGIYEGMQATH